MYRLATVHNVTDRQTTDGRHIMRPLVARSARSHGSKSWHGIATPRRTSGHPVLNRRVTRLAESAHRAVTVYSVYVML